MRPRVRALDVATRAITTRMRGASVAILALIVACKGRDDHVTPEQPVAVAPAPAQGSAAAADPWASGSAAGDPWNDNASARDDELPPPDDPFPRPFVWVAEKGGKTTTLVGTMHAGIDAKRRLPKIGRAHV